MTFEISKKHQVVPKVARVRRNMQWLSHDSKSILDVTEVTDLFISGKPLSRNGNVMLCKCHTSDDLDMDMGPGPLWYEIGIISTMANNLLHQNVNLEAGEETAWTVRDMTSSGAFEALYRPACYMLTQMDGVGFWNRFRPGSETPSIQQSLKPKSSSKVEKSNAEAKPDGGDFW